MLAVRARLDAACARSGRDAGCVRLLAVTKTVPARICAQLAALGQLELGESRAQDLISKAADCAAAGLDLRWHLVGHLQRNKARGVVRVASEVHSVDSPRLLETLERVAGEERRRPGIYLEVDYTGRQGRTGLAERDVRPLVEEARRLEHVQLLGLMTLAPPPGEDAPDPLGGARSAFERLAALREALPADAFAGGRALLSMGMSSDFELAVELGADVVRVGSALFEGLAPADPTPAEEGAA